MQGSTYAEAPFEADDVLIVDDSPDRIYAKSKLDKGFHLDLGRAFEPLTH